MKLLSTVLVTAAMLGGNLFGGTSGRWAIVVSPEGSVQVDLDGKEAGVMRPGLFGSQWQFAMLEAGKAGAAVRDGIHRGVVYAPGGTGVGTELTATAEGAGARFNYRLTPQREMELNSLNVTLSLPVALWAGGSCLADGNEVTLPSRYKDMQLWSAPTKVLQLATPNGQTLQLDLARPAQVLVQDDRQWGESFSVRIESQNAPRKWTAGRSMEMAIAVTAPEGLTLEKDGPVTIRACADWLPLEPALDIEPGSALDFSHVVPHHAPAGKFGAVIVNPRGKFAFEQRADNPVRFYGVNFCFSAHYISHEDADAVAIRLARQGYNSVRFHHYESELIDRASGTTVRLKPDKLDQLDYLFAAFKKNGLYVTTDIFVSRPVPAAAIYEGETGDIGMDEFKMAVHVNEKAFENYKAFARALLDHVNPYTKLRYADDPALASLCLVNECCPGNFIGRLKGKLRADWQREWNQWLLRRYNNRDELKRALGTLPADQDPARGNVPFQNVYASSPAAVVFNVFLADVERKFFERTRKFLRDELGCRALLTDCNAWTNPVQLQDVRREFDYVDDHFYVDHPQFLERPWSLPSRCPNTSPISGGARGGRNCAFTRMMGKPFTITEYNYSAPGRFRGVGGILTGTLGALQDWDGLWRFAYSHNRGTVTKPGAMNYFDIAGDPLNLAAERASLCLFLRGDITPAVHTVVIGATHEELIEAPTTSCDRTPAWQALAWVTRVGWTVDADTRAGPSELLLPFAGGKAMQNEAENRIVNEFRERGWLPEGNLTDLKENLFQSENGQVTIDAPENTLTLDTPLTAGGFAPAGRTIKTGAATIEVLDTDATVWVSSLDGNPICTSKRLLLTHLTDLQNSEIRYGDRARKTLLAWGHLPHLVRAGRAVVKLKLADAGRAKVYSLAVSGKRLGELTARTSNSGILSVPLSVDANGKARMLYEIEIGE